MRVLVTGAGGNVAEGILKSLLKSKLQLALYTTCIHEYSPWLHHPDINGFLAPRSDSEAYIDFLISFINYHKIDVLIPTIDSEILNVTSSSKRISESTGATVFVSNYEATRICNDKYLTYQFLLGNNLCFPKTWLGEEIKKHGFDLNSIPIPCLQKSRIGNASSGVKLVKTREDLDGLTPCPDSIIQELLPSTKGEYTAGVYIGDDKKIKGSCIFRRTLKHGYTNVAHRINDMNLLSQVEEIALKLNMKYVNIQSMLVGDKLVPFEFNGRLSGTTAMVERVFNAPELFIRERVLKQSIKYTNNLPDEFIAIRYLEEMYITPGDLSHLRLRSQNHL